MSPDDVDELLPARADIVPPASAVQLAGAHAVVVQRDADAAAVLAEQERLRERGLPAPSLSAVVVKASALALREHPGVNASWRRGAIVEHARIHVGVTVVAAHTLRVPVIRDADRLSLAALGWVVDELARQVRAGQLPARATGGATFTVADLGGLRVDPSVAVLEPPQAAILTVDAAPARGPGGGERPLRLRLTYDGRVLDRAAASAFVGAVADAVEVPLALAS